MGNTPHVQRLIYRPHFVPGSVVLITGASGALGSLLAYRYAEKGANLMLTGRNASLLEEVAAKCKTINGSIKIECKTCNVTEDAENKQLVEHCLQVFGKIDILILCVGISGHQLFSENPDLSVVRRLMETNFIGYASITKFALDSLRKNKGQIIVINSMSGLIGLPFRTAYCASKYAVRGFFEALAIEEPDINILKVYP